MEEATATVTASITVKLTGEPGEIDAEGNQMPGVSAEEKATNTAQLIRDQIAAIRRTYDTGVEVTGTLKYVGRGEEAL